MGKKRRNKRERDGERWREMEREGKRGSVTLMIRK